MLEIHRIGINHYRTRGLGIGRSWPRSIGNGRRIGIGGGKGNSRCERKCKSVSSGWAIGRRKGKCICGCG